MDVLLICIYLGHLLIYKYLCVCVHRHKIGLLNLSYKEHVRRVKHSKQISAFKIKILNNRHQHDKMDYILENTYHTKRGQMRKIKETYLHAYAKY